MRTSVLKILSTVSTYQATLPRIFCLEPCSLRVVVVRLKASPKIQKYQDTFRFVPPLGYKNCFLGQ